LATPILDLPGSLRYITTRNFEFKLRFDSLLICKVSEGHCYKARYLEWSVTMERFIGASEFVHLSSVKYCTVSGGLSFMDGRGFVGISVLKRERKWGLKGNNVEMLQTLSFGLRRHVTGLGERGFGPVPNFKNTCFDTEQVLLV
jgi:hypothetical protein